MRARKWLPVAVALAIVGTILSPSAGNAQGEDEGSTQVPEGAAHSLGETTPDVVDPVVPEDARASDLGKDWTASEDRMVSATGSALGYSILVAEAAHGYDWKNLVTLSSPGVETDRWVGNMCLTADGSKAAVVYAPRAATNDTGQMLQGAFGAIVDTTTGDVTDLGRKYTLAYFNPGCGTNNTIVMTAFSEAGGTRLMPFDATTGTAGAEITLDRHITSATADSVGLVGAVPGEVVRIESTGSTSTLTNTTGVSHRLQPTADGGLVVVDHDTKSSRVRYVAPGATANQATELATGDLAEVGVTRDTRGKLYLTGKPKKKTRDFGAVLSDQAVPANSEVSSMGELAVTSIYAFETERAKSPGELKPLVDVEGQSLKTSKKLHFTVPIASGAADADAAAPEVPSPRTRGLPSSGSLTDPVEAERSCSVPRNDPKNQVLQPKPRQVEWAVDEAVSGGLTFTRDKNWKNLGIGSYSPQGLFPKPALIGGGSVPAQVVLGVLAQESNLWQASRYTTPGVTGNPLIGNFYGNDSTSSSDDKFFTVNWADADCGYGVGQITDGMRLAGKEKPGETAYPYQTQRAIALDYTVNVAAAVKMLSDKWNQVTKAGMKINNGDPERLENWFYALWAYNTGFYQKGSDSSGNWGVGWFNNPINPTYNPARGPFLDRSPADAANPQRWPYPEKALGFAAHSLELQEDANNVVPGFRTAWWPGTDGASGVVNRANVKPPLGLFCDTSNKCNPKTTGACPDDNSNCWYHNSATWKKNCDETCGYEFIRFDPGEYAEQADANSFPPNCGATGLPSGSLIVDNLPSGTSAVRGGCSPVASKGSFQFAFNQGPNGTVPAKMDLHQLGGGFNGQFYFSHNYDEGYLNNRMKITGTWTLGQSLKQWTRVFVHMPDHGAWTQQAAYLVDTGNGVKQRVVLQRHFANTWVSLGVFNIAGTPKVTLDNTPITTAGEPIQDRAAPRDAETGVAADYNNNNGVIDIAWDAVAFQPLPGKPKDIVVAMGDSFSSGEGASDLNGANYYRSTDHGGNKDSMSSDTMNACHRSAEAWARKATLPGASKSNGARSDTWDNTLDFQFIACSGAESENLLPYYTVPDSQRPVNAIGQSGEKGQWGEVSQLDTGFLDENTTLVTLSIGGNDIGFKNVITTCLSTLWACEYVKDASKPGKTLSQATKQRTTVELPTSLDTILREIRKKAPSAQIMLMGYPNLFENRGLENIVPCTFAGGLGGWLSDMSGDLNKSLADAVAKSNLQNPTQPPARFANPVSDFSGKALCTNGTAINTLTFTLSPGDYGAYFELGVPGGPNFGMGPSAQSVHPNQLGTDLYANAMNRTLREK
ncbi:hypothetical protein ACFRFH_16560 [Leifsonia sp. NPDC056824]|uniref:hypothetical protein n=1 Tax=Leifsonia sp. NPDC056824 TaxID=3345953 RepID=UPI00368C6225